MTLTLILEQALNGLQFGLMLFLLAAGLTLVFGIMDMINLAHGSLYMVGAYLTAAVMNLKTLIGALCGNRITPIRPWWTIRYRTPRTSSTINALVWIAA